MVRLTPAPPIQRQEIILLAFFYLISWI